FVMHRHNANQCRATCMGAEQLFQLCSVEQSVHLMPDRYGLQTFQTVAVSVLQGAGVFDR
ncbi:hypothetical protein, partial [Pseudomonas kulmbachensis]|uniref:hypothetical protein n=1 Tax=Pseudomonas kulmbachensis TaxID=3043408 RepID=UPI002AB24B97